MKIDEKQATKIVKVLYCFSAVGIIITVKWIIDGIIWLFNHIQII